MNQANRLRVAFFALAVVGVLAASAQPSPAQWPGAKTVRAPWARPFPPRPPLGVSFPSFGRFVRVHARRSAFAFPSLGCTAI
jgi:hypothetical protein